MHKQRRPLELFANHLSRCGPTGVKHRPPVLDSSLPARDAAFGNDPDIALRVLTTGMPEKAYRTLRPLLRIFPSYYRFRHKISEADLEKDRAVVAAALDRIEQERQGRAYLAAWP